MPSPDRNGKQNRTINVSFVVLHERPTEAFAALTKLFMARFFWNGWPD
ncbi:MAG: hypothetical protein PSV16_07875 [Flavobacterium sp.]|nr:hypothetical protein [Flavobacterium sp.]